MASRTIWKIRDRGGVLVGQTLYAEDAAALVALFDGGSVVYDHFLTVWREGREAFSAADSYDAARDVMHARLDAYRNGARDMMGAAPLVSPHRAGLRAAGALHSEAFKP